MRRKNMLTRNLTQTIRRSLGRYLAILAIVALGAGLFCGLRVTKVDMVATLQKYTDAQNMFDLQLISTYGWREEDVAALAAAPLFSDAEGSISLDALLQLEQQDAAPYRLISLPSQVNQVSLAAGRLPQAPDECLLDSYHTPESVIGQQIYVASGNDADTLDNLAYDTYTVVGLATTPLYLNMQRGSTTIGSGALRGFVYIPREGFSLEFYTEINLSLAGQYRVYTQTFDDAMDDAADQVEPLAQSLMENRFQEILEDAEAEFAEGRQEYLDGMAQYRSEKADAMQTLQDAYAELTDGQAQVDENRQTLTDGWAQLTSAQATVDSNRQTLADSRRTLEQTKADTYAQLDQAQAELDEAYPQVVDGLAQVNDGLAQIESALPLLDVALQAAQELLAQMQNQPFIDEETLADLQTRVQELAAQRDELVAQQAYLLETKATLEASLAQIQAGYAQLEAGRAQADAQFAEAEQQLSDGEAQLASAQYALNQSRAELADGEKALAEAEAELAQGWQEYHDGLAEAQAEFAKAEAELADARQELAQGRADIDALEPPELYALTRNTNLGYVVFESDSDIVAGVAKIFPLFFLAVAALVCITTMTRMIDEERTQIGIFKALGYSSAAIMGKYLAYSGSACLLGCLLGLALGSTVLPMTIWYAYCIMYNFSDQLVLSYDPASIVFVFLSYLVLTLAVTWNCCRRELQDVPAELIRPKSPVAGKQILLEKLPFWKRLKFLNKVAIRNIFRYRQRLAMMLLGIGGCTSLLITGFGLRDSVSDIASYQFQQVMVYDIGLTFADPLDAQTQAQFRDAHPDQQILFCYQGGIDLEFDNGVKNVYLLASDEAFDGFIDIHDEHGAIPMPGPGQAVISIGAATALGIQPGDTVTLRNSDHQELSVVVSGVFNNHVYNYAIVHGDTLREQWDQEPEIQTAFVCANPGQDVHELGAALGSFDGVMNLTINQDTSDSVGGMMDAMDMIIVVVVVCAGLLAGIVLYNLTNINIQERIREIATIKVLGFHDGETASYVFKENLALTLVGALLGLAGGKLLHAAVMSYVRIDMVWFDNRIAPMSYIISFLLTIFSAILVDFLMYFQLDKINMAEALKSVE